MSHLRQKKTQLQHRTHSLSEEKTSALKGQCCMNKLRGKAGELLDKSLEEINESSNSYSSDGDSSDQDNEQTYSEKMNVIYSNTTDTVINNKCSSTSRSLSINNSKGRAVSYSKKRPKSFARPQEAWT